jgi:hypothetical protein
MLEEMGAEEKRINMTDPESANMKHKDSTIKPSYNHQSVRDSKYGIVTAVATMQTVDKPKDMIQLVNSSKENTSASHKNVTADSGFCDYEILKEIEDNRQEEYYVPDRRFESSKKGKTSKGKISY